MGTRRRQTKHITHDELHGPHQTTRGEPGAHEGCEPGAREECEPGAHEGCEPGAHEGCEPGAREGWTVPTTYQKPQYY